MSSERNVNLKITSKNFLTTAEKYERSKIWEVCMNEEYRCKEWNVYCAKNMQRGKHTYF